MNEIIIGIIAAVLLICLAFIWLGISHAIRDKKERKPTLRETLHAFFWFNIGLAFLILMTFVTVCLTGRCFL